MIAVFKKSVPEVVYQYFAVGTYLVVVISK